ncbi:sulfurtransferase [Ekhidna sp.]|uniref:sulfurtransferase n=1 Tax=Ekhidna sp. TaxID=2608089 RepID=UPI003C7A956B
MQKIKILILLFLVNPCLGTAQEPSILVGPEWLEKRMQKDNLVIFHIGRESDYKKEHIPGAVYMSSEDYTIGTEDRSIVFDLPTNEDLKDLFEKNGITNETDVVIYTPANWIPLVTRLYFTLDYLGHGHKTYILDGGIVAWKNGGRVISTEVNTPKKGSFNIEPNKSLLADENYMLASIDNKENTIVDCRSEVYYKGIEPTHGARLGRIPNAKNIPYTTLYEPSDIGAYTFKSIEELGNIFNGQGLSKDEPLVLYCHIGMQLTVVYTAAKLLGYKDIRMYDGSFHEWGPNEDLPIELD